MEISTKGRNMKKILFGLLSLGVSIQLSASSDVKNESGLIFETGYGFALDPYRSHEPDSVFEIKRLEMEPADFSKAIINDGDKYIMIGLDIPHMFGENKDMGLSIGGRLHQREGVKYEVDFSARLTKELSPSWSIFGGGGFGIGELEVGFDKIVFESGDVVDYPDSMDYGTAYFQFGTEYRITNSWSVLAFYEIKEMAVDSEELKSQINWEGTDPFNAIAMAQMVGAYESTTNAVYVSVKYKF